MVGRYYIRVLEIWRWMLDRFQQPGAVTVYNFCWERERVTYTKTNSTQTTPAPHNANMMQNKKNMVCLDTNQLNKFIKGFLCWHYTAHPITNRQLHWPRQTDLTLSGLKCSIIYRTKLATLSSVVLTLHCATTTSITSSWVIFVHPPSERSITIPLNILTHAEHVLDAQRPSRIVMRHVNSVHCCRLTENIMFVGHISNPVWITIYVVSNSINVNAYCTNCGATAAN